MIHIVCHDFKSTTGNHAGMRHLYEEICRKISNTSLYITNKDGVGVRYCNRFIAIYIAVVLVIKYKKGDKFLFTEDIFKPSFHAWIISIIHFFHPQAPIFAMVHLTPADIKKRFTQKDLQKEATKVSSLITLGSSLTTFFNQIGISNVHTSFHYLDTEYYNTLTKKENKFIKIIVMGAMARNFEMIAEIVRKAPFAHFIVCKGLKDIDSLFDGLSNVTLLGYLPEEELKNQMALADVSLNVMDDTIGSNVICSSLGMGLAMLCSDVGSIRDYCNCENTIFCKTVDDFVTAIAALSKNSQSLKKMQSRAFLASKRLCVNNYINDIWNLMGETPYFQD